MDANALARDVRGRAQERPVYVDHDGERLFGIVHEPEKRHDGVALLFASSGVQNRSGPHRMYVQAARRFSQLGLTSLRLDLPGVGDSVERKLGGDFDLHDPASVVDAIEFLVANHDVRRVVLVGLCAGARVAVKAAARHPKVDAVIAWSMPIISGAVDMPVEEGGGAYMGRAMARAQLREWAPKLVNPAAWYRYLRSEKTVAEGWRMMQRALSGFLPEPLRQKSSRQTDFLSSLDSYVASGRKMLCVYGGDDDTVRTEFGERYPEIVAHRSSSCDYLVVPNADHTYTRIAASEEVIARTSDWLARHYTG
jgi:pimeloyl-ACP methyl ester carboxylesterase